jgi:hypothetical protein
VRVLDALTFYSRIKIVQMTFGETPSIRNYVGSGLTGFDDCSLLFGDDLTGHFAAVVGNCPTRRLAGLDSS